MTMLRRVGKFKIDNEVIQNELAFELFKFLEFVPTRAEQLWHLDAIEYVGISPKFREIAKGEQVPEYRIEGFWEHTTKSMTVKVAEVSVRREDVKDG